MARKAVSIQIEESLQDAFRNKCDDAKPKLKYSDVAEALLQAYVDGKVDVKVETRYTVTSKGMED